MKPTPVSMIKISKEDMTKLTVKKLIKKYKYSETGIRRYMKKQNIIPVAPKRKISFNLDFFRTMTEELAYVLGWIASDGCIVKNSVKLSLQVSDKPILECLKKLTGHTRTVEDTSQYDTRTLKTYHHAVLCWHSKALVQILATYGLGPRKSLTLEYPSLPDDMQASFVRGFFDGDGCISKMAGANGNYRISFCGPRTYLEALRAVINAQNKLDTGSITQNKNIAVLAYTGRRSAETILRWMYETSTHDTRLQRKYLKYMLALDDGERRESTKERAAFEHTRKILIAKGNAGMNLKETSVEKYGLNFDAMTNTWS